VHQARARRGATLLGLLAGARDQLVKLDLVGGIIAVFLLGFSADAIKNLHAHHPILSGSSRRPGRVGSGTASS
jgi:hypothetical protein